MPYATYTEVIADDPKLSNAEVISQAKVEQIIAAMSSLIDSHLESLYVVPLANPPAIIKQLTLDLTVGKTYQLIAYRSDNLESQEGNRIYDDALALLRDLRGERTDPLQPWQPKIFLPGVPFKAGIIRTEYDAIVYEKSTGSGTTFWSSALTPRRRAIDRGNPFPPGA